MCSAMLLAVEGGGFFSSSALGYTSGLSLLLLGRRNEERPLKVSPWNQYHLMEQDVDPNPHLASQENRAPCRCTSFNCFNCGTKGLSGTSPAPKVSQPDLLSDSPGSENGNRTSYGSFDESARKGHLKSSLKKPFTACSVIIEGDSARDSSEEVQGAISCCAQRRKVQWTDACGKELAEIREFESSDLYASDEDSDRGGFRRCECVIQ